MTIFGATGFAGGDESDGVSSAEGIAEIVDWTEDARTGASTRRNRSCDGGARTEATAVQGRRRRRMR